MESSPSSISGAITGNVVDDNNVSTLYIRDANGHITEYPIPGQGNQSGQGSSGNEINVEGVVAGTWITTGPEFTVPFPGD